MLWELSALNKLYKTNSYSQVRRRIINQKTVYIIVLNKKISLNQKAKLKFNNKNEVFISEEELLLKYHLNWETLNQKGINDISLLYMYDCFLELTECLGFGNITAEVCEEIKKWILVSFYLAITEEDSVLEEYFQKINDHLKFKSTLIGTYISIADVFLTSALKRIEEKMSNALNKTRDSFINLKRWHIWIYSILGVDWDKISQSLRRKDQKMEKTRIKLTSSKELLIACKQKEYQKVQDLLDKGANIESQDLNKNLRRCSHIACKNKDMKMMELLLKYKCDITAEDSDKMTPLYYAIQAGSIPLTALLLDLGSNLEHKEVQHRTPLYWAASLGELELMEYLIGKGADINAKSTLGRCALSKACWNGKIDVLERLLKCNTLDINSQDSNLRTPLHNAVWGSTGGRLGKKTSINEADSPECAKLLLENGAQIDVPDIDGNTPLHISSSSNGQKSQKLLLEYGANVNHQNYRKTTPLHKSCKRDLLTCMITLLENNADMDLEDEGGFKAFDFLLIYDFPVLYNYILLECKLPKVKKWVEENYAFHTIAKLPENIDTNEEIYWNFFHQNFYNLILCIDQNSYECITLLLDFLLPQFVQYYDSLPSNSEKETVSKLWTTLLRRSMIFKSLQCTDLLLDYHNFFHFLIREDELELSVYTGNQLLFLKLFSLYSSNNPRLKTIPEKPVKAAIFCKNIEILTLIVSKYHQFSPSQEESKSESQNLEPTQQYVDWNDQIKRIFNIEHLHKKCVLSFDGFGNPSLFWEHPPLNLAIVLEHSNEAKFIINNTDVDLSLRSRKDLATSLILATKLGEPLLVEDILKKYKKSVNKNKEKMEWFGNLKDGKGLSALDYCRISRRHHIHSLFKLFTNESNSYLKLDYRVLSSEEIKPIIQHETIFLEKITKLNQTLETFKTMDDALKIPDFQYFDISHELRQNILWTHNYLDSIIHHEKTPCFWIDTIEKLEEVSQNILQNHKIIGVDQEYFLLEKHALINSLLQISTTKADYVIDALILRKSIHKYLNPIFSNSKIIKVVHGCDTDLQLLMTDFNIYCENVFDTGRAYYFCRKMFHQTKGYQFASLYNLVKNLLNIELDKFFQVSDWRIRPLPEAMLNYARSDSHYLIYLYHILSNFLNKKPIWISPSVNNEIGNEDNEPGCEVELPEEETFLEGNGLVMLALHCNWLITERINKNHNSRVELFVEQQIC